MELVWVDSAKIENTEITYLRPLWNQYDEVLDLKLVKANHDLKRKSSQKGSEEGDVVNPFKGTQ